ncbi:hypothetical protein [Actinoplanes sp. NPDC051859]|uniref:hypothetical protein n=1 Tax=Actinoplanes sp. NPDC051859 TaxID=3363909 RepID=UPI0037B255E2
MIEASPHADHLPSRPSWDCTTCGEPWPCAPAKIALTEEFREDPLSLALYLWAQLEAAIDDFMGNRLPIPQDLYHRLVGWRRGGMPS